MKWNFFKKEKEKPTIEVLGWSGPESIHYTFKIKQSQFADGYLNVWVEYNNVGKDFIETHTNNVISGLELIDIKNEEDGEHGTSFIYKVAPLNTTLIKNVEIEKGESVLGLQDCDFSCCMKVFYRPRLHTREGMLLLHEHEI